MNIRIITRRFCTSNKAFNAKYDMSQVKSFEEQLILVDHNDEIVGPISKLNGLNNN